MDHLKYYLSIFKESYEEWNNDKAPRLGAALAYYTVFSIAPCFLLIVAIVGFFFGEQAARGQIYNEVRGLVGPDGAKAIEDLVASSKNEGTGLIATLIGLGILFVGTTGVIGQIQDALDTVWEVESESPENIFQMIQRRWVYFSIIIAFGFVLVVSLFASTLLQAISEYYAQYLPFSTSVVEVAHQILSLIVLTGFFSITFRFVSNIIIPWRDIFSGAAFTSILFVLGKTLLGIYLGRAAFSSTFGAAGSLVVILVWVYYSSQIFLFGAELTQVLTRRSSRSAIPKPGFKFSKENAWPNLSKLQNEHR